MFPGKEREKLLKSERDHQKKRNSFRTGKRERGGNNLSKRDDMKGNRKG